MRARDILDTTHQLEEKGMTRPQAETISKALAAAVEPLATKEEVANEFKVLREKDLKGMEERLSRNMTIGFEKINTRIESMKVWLLGGVFTGLLAIAVSVLFLAFQLGAVAAPRGEFDLGAGRSDLRQSEAVQSATSDQTNL